MLNLIKMDLHRLVRIKSFWIMIAVTILITFFSVYMTHFDVSSQDDTVPETNNNSTTDISSDNVEITFGVYIDTKSEWADKMDFTDLMNTHMVGMVVAILCVIFPPIFVNGEQKNGFLKNIVGQLPNRGMLVLSKLLVVAIQVLVIFGVFSISSAVIGKILWGDKLVFESISDFAKVISIHYLLHFALASLIAALTVILRGSGFSMTFGILCSTGFMTLLYTFVNIILHKCGAPEDFNIGNYTIDNCITIVNKELSNGDLTRVIVVGLAFLIISTLIASTVIQKRDIR